MKNTATKRALKLYQGTQGNFATKPAFPLKKEADLESFYYPGVTGVIGKIAKKESNRAKYCSSPRTIGVISTQGVDYYPILTAKAALLSQTADVNAIPLLIRYSKLGSLAERVEQLSHNFQFILCAGFGSTEREVLQKNYQGDCPLLFDEQAEAAAVVAAALSGSNLLKKSAKGMKVVTEGHDLLMKDIVCQLSHHGFENLTLLDDKGAMYKKRPSMNRQKNELIEIVKTKKDERSRAEILAEADLYICSKAEDLSAKDSDHLGDKAVIITLKSEKVHSRAKQTVVSTLPTLPNHITDLHIAAGIAKAMTEGHEPSEKTLIKATLALSKVFKTPKRDKLIPGLLEKNLAKKIAKSL